MGAPDREQKPGDVLGAYRLVRPLGSGGSGSAWLAEGAGGEGCVKVLDRALSGRSSEVRLIAALDHPHVVRLLDWSPGDAATPPWLVMPAARGGTLVDRLAPERLLVWTRQLLSALAHAHARHVLHLDLKPANVLLASADPDSPVWLADFSIGQRAGVAGARESVRGTPGYVAPEQVGRDSPVDARTDLFGLGCTLVRLITGRSPRGEASTDPVLSARSPVELTGIDPDWQAFLERLVALHPVDRFRSAPHALAHLPAAAPRQQLREATDDGATLATGLTRLDQTRTIALPSRPGSPRAPVAASPARPRAGAAGSHLRLFSVRALPQVGREDLRADLLARARAVRTRPGWVALAGVGGEDPTGVARWLMESVREGGHALAIGDQPGLSGLGLAGVVTLCAGASGVDDETFLDRMAVELGGRAARRSTLWSLARAVRPSVDVPITLQGPGEAIAALIPWVEERCAREPLVLLADDPEEAASLERRLARTRPSLPVLTVFTTPTAALGLDPGRGEVVEVPPLAPTEYARLVASLLPLEPGLAEALYRLTGGATGVLVEVLRWWVDRGVLVGGPGGLRLARQGDPRLPDDLTAIPRERLSLALRGLPEDAVQQALAVAVAWGDALAGDRWRRALPEDVAELGEVIQDRLTHAELVRASGDALVWASPTVREAARSLAEPHLSAASTRCAEVARAERLGPGILGALLSAAGDHQAAIDALCDAVDDPGTYSTVVEQLALLDRAAASATQLGLPDEDPRQARILQRRAQLLMKRGHPERARELAWRVVRAHLGGTLEAGALRVIADAHARLGDLATARELLVRACDLPGVEVEAQAWTVCTAVGFAVRDGDAACAEALLERARALTPRTARVRVALAGAEDSVARHHGDIDARRIHLADGLDAGRALGHRPTQASYLVNLGDLERMAGDLDAAERRLTEARDLLDACGMDINAALADVNLGQVALQRDDGAAALAHLARAGDRLEVMGAGHYLAFVQLLRAEALQLVGDGAAWRGALVDALEGLRRYRLVDPDLLQSLERQRDRAHDVPEALHAAIATQGNPLR